MPLSVASLSRGPCGSTLFLGVDAVARLIRQSGLPACLSGIAACIREDFARWGAFDKTARVPHHAGPGVIELMPVGDAARYAFKYVTGYPRNHRAGLSTVMAFGALADAATGQPVLLSELTLTTALRTAATSVVAAQRLARADSRVMAVIGNGAQSEFQALAFQHGLGIEALRLFDTDPAASAKLAANLAGSGLHVTRCASAAEAVQGADIVTTLTADQSNATILTAGMLAPGMHINAVGGDSPGKTELHPDVLRLGPVFVEYEPQTRIEGDIQQMTADFGVTELWRVLSGAHPGRGSAREVTVFDSVGFALEDFSALRFLHAAALEDGVGETIDLIPTLADPKNLFARLQGAAQPTAPAAALRSALATI